MYPELFEIPFIHVTLKSYGLMMVIGFLAAVSIIRHISRDFTPNPQLVTNGALYTLIAGVIGARAFYVIHHYDKLDGGLLSVFALWRGGLELYGAVILAIPVLFFFLLYHKLPIRQYLDIIAIGLMLALAFGRIGCFLNGCCFGKPTKLPWGIHFPYNSIAYLSQINVDLDRNRHDPHLRLPREEYLSYIDTDGNWHPKPYEELTEEQKFEVNEGKYRCLPVHPTQLYASVNAAVLCLILYLFWRRSKKAELAKNSNKLFTKNGSTFALMFILYGIARFLIEFLRDDNPFEFDGLTISQNIGIAMFILGVVLMAIFQKMKPKSLKP